MDYFVGLCHKDPGKGHGRSIQSEGDVKFLLELYYADDLSSIGKKKSCKIRDFLGILRGARIRSKIKVIKTKSYRTGINEGEWGMLGNENVNQVDSFTYLGSVISKEGRYRKDGNK